MKYKFGILGCGRVTEHYKYILINVNPIQKIEISACCDLNLDKAKSMAASFEANHYSDLDEMISNEDLDVILVLTPSGDHYEHSKHILESGCSVLVEKPICLIPEHAYELANLAKDKGLNYSGIFQNRYNPAMQAAREVIDQGRLGKIVSASVRLIWCRYQDYYNDEWHGRWSSDGGVISQQAIHHIDAINWLCGPIEKVSSVMDRRINKLEAEDTLVATFITQVGALGTIQATTAARPDDYEASVTIIGENGMIEIGGVALNEVIEWKFLNPTDADLNAKEKYTEAVPNGYGLSHGRILSDYVRKLDNGEELPITPEDSVKAVELVHALYSSAENNEWVELSKKPRSLLLGKK